MQLESNIATFNPEISDYACNVAIKNSIGTLILKSQQAQKQVDGDWFDFSSGSPQVFPELAKEVKAELSALIDSGEIDNYIGEYGAIAIDQAFEKELNEQMLKLGVDTSNQTFLATPGSMASIFYASNVFGGNKNSVKNKILMPQSPDFPDYPVMGLDETFYRSIHPEIYITRAHYFRYRYDLAEIDFSDISMVLLSRPCNPSGFILGNEELRGLVEKAKIENVVVAVDSAYSKPFPDLIFDDDSLELITGENVINIFSFSKAGLPGSRAGVVMGPKELINPLKIFQLNCCLTAPNLGQALAARLMSSNKLNEITQSVVKPFYRDRIHYAHKVIERNINDEVPYHLHEADGGMFVWLWLKDLPVTDMKLHELLHTKHTNVSPGSIFFYGLENKLDKHTHECIRISVTEDKDLLDKGLVAICETINELYSTREN